MPKGVVPFLNVTVPVGVPTVALTVAVTVTVWPLADGFGDEVRAVMLASLETT